MGTEVQYIWCIGYRIMTDTIFKVVCFHRFATGSNWEKWAWKWPLKSDAGNHFRLRSNQQATHGNKAMMDYCHCLNFQFEAAPVRRQVLEAQGLLVSKDPISFIDSLCGAKIFNHHPAQSSSANGILTFLPNVSLRVMMSTAAKSIMHAKSCTNF